MTTNPQATGASSPTSTPTKSILDTAAAAGNFKTLAAALTAAGLIDTLSGPGPFTVFAPNDEAFKKVNADTLAGLLKSDSKAKLADILKLHVISGRVLARDIDGKTLHPKSVQGEELTVDGINGVRVNGAKVTTADILCTNGVIHVIDSVIMPKQAAKH